MAPPGRRAPSQLSSLAERRNELGIGHAQPDGHIRKYPWWDTQRLSDWLAAQPR